jgi:hypothetical protein
MAENAESGQETPEGDQVPENAKRDSQGVPYGTGDETGQKTYSREGDLPVGTEGSENPLYTPGAEVGNPAPGTGYVENPAFVPDPTAMTGTLETSGTGGGANETVRGTTGVFEEAGLASYRSTDVVSGDATGQPEPHAGADAAVAGAAPTSYQETTISGAAPGPREGEAEGAFTTARTPAEGSEDGKTSEETSEDEKDAQEPAEGDTEQSETKAPAKQTAAAKKTAARKTTASRTQSKN